jgi:uncharacterized protein YjbJ (UPF0337 family)
LARFALWFVPEPHWLRFAFSGARSRAPAFEPEDETMSWDQIEAKWDQFKGDVKATWAKLTDEDLKFVAGQRDRLVGKLHERYGTLKDQAYKDIDAWVTRVNDKMDRAGKH